MQYRLSTLFLIFFFVATSMATFGAWGFLFLAGVLLAAIALNRAHQLSHGVAGAALLLFFGVAIPGTLPAIHRAKELYDPEGSQRTVIGVYLALAVWLVSIILLFRRAIKNRKPEVAARENASPTK